MGTFNADRFVGFNALGSGKVRFRTAGCGSCAWFREVEGEEAAQALRSFATVLRQRAEEAEVLAERIDALRK